MFQKTKIQLTALNAIIFFIVIALLSTVIYFFCEATLYNKVDESLIKAATNRVHFSNTWKMNDGILTLDPRKGIVRQNDPTSGVEDPNITELYWNDKSKMLTYQLNWYTDNVEAFLPKGLEEFQKVVAAGHSFQTYTVYVGETNLFPGENIKIQYLRNIDSEEALLHNLLVILIVGNIIGAVVVVGVGYYLSGRALIPINQAWEKQQQFVSDASHELRTPLTVIQTRTDLLLREPDATIEDKIMDVSAISKETRRLSKLVANLLTLARSDSNQVEINKKEFRLDLLLNEIVEQFVDIAEFKEKELTYEIPEGLTLYGDKEKIHQLMIILIDNALKFTKAEGNIKISSYELGSHVHITVSDTGMGIKPESLTKVFDRFYQGDKSRTNSEGTGLGLSIAKWIVEKHGGKIHVESVVDEGTTFNIVLPKSKKN